MQNYYSILELPFGSNISEVKQAFRRLAKIHHPDKGGNKEKFEKIHTAYVNLCNENTKEFYDSYDANYKDLFDILIKRIKEITIILKEKSKTKYTPQEESKPKQKPKQKPIYLNITATLDEVYRGDFKKVVVRVKEDNNTLTKKVLYINLMEHKSEYIFKNYGDLFEDGTRNDIIVKLKIREHEYIKIDSILDKHDLYIEKPISLYEYIYGVNIDIPFFDGEVISIYEKLTMTDDDRYMCVYIEEGMGLPYINNNNDILYGDLYVYFHLSLDFAKIETHKNLDDVKNIIKIYFNDTAREL